MNTHLIALELMAFQGLLGAFDTIYHHELTEALPGRTTARRELTIHSARAVLYSLLFVGLSAWEWYGLWTVLLILIIGVEIVLTLWDFVIEDKTRLLPASERVIHTILAINGGAFIALLALDFPEWLGQATDLQLNEQGALSVFLILCGVGVGLSGIRDGFAAFRIGREIANAAKLPPIRFGERAESVLVTGGSGFIGQFLVRALLADGHHVTLLTRTPKSTAWLFDGRVSCISAFSELPEQAGISVIINLAGARILGPRWSAARRAVLLRSRVDLTRQLVDWIGTAIDKPRLLISASAIGYYGVQPTGDDTALTEASAPQPIFMSELCQQWEAAASLASEHGVKVARVRFGLVLGRQGALPMMMMPIRLGIGGPLGGGRQWLTWIHVHDLLRAVAHVWSSPITGRLDVAYNFTAPLAVTQKQFSQIAARAVKRPSFMPTPGLPMRLILGEQADLLLKGQRVMPARLQAEGFSFVYPDLDKAMRDLG